MDNREVTEALMKLIREVGTLEGTVANSSSSVERLDKRISGMDEKIDRFFEKRYETCPYKNRKREDGADVNIEVMKSRLRVATVGLVVAGIALIPSWILLIIEIG